MFCNLTNISKAKEIETFCLIKRMDLRQANLDPKDYSRFAGKEINFLISFDENFILDVSAEDEVSVITGMYGPTDMKEFKKTANGINYKNEIDIKGDKEGEMLKYNYYNTITIVDGKPTSLYAKVDQSGFSFNSWNFQIDCRDYKYSEAEKQDAKKTLFFEEKSLTQEERMKKKIKEMMEDEDLQKRMLIEKNKIIKKIDIGAVLNLKDIKEEYSCVQKDVSNADTVKWKLSIFKPWGEFSTNLFVENSCCPERGKRLAFYHKEKNELIEVDSKYYEQEYPPKLIWFDLIDENLHFNTLELNDYKLKNKKFSIKLEGTDYKKFNKLYNKAEIAKKDYDAELIGYNTYWSEQEKFFYAPNAFFRERMKDNNNFTTLIDADCK